MKAPLIFAGSVLTGAAFLMMTACSHETVNAASNVEPAATVESVADRNVVSVPSPERFLVAPAAVRRESDQILANGVVAADVSRTYPVTALSSGRVVDIRARLGDDVQKGQLLLTMTSPDMSQAISDYQKFRASEALAKTQLDRAQLLSSVTECWRRKIWRSPRTPTTRPRSTRRPLRNTFAFWEEIRSISRR